MHHRLTLTCVFALLQATLAAQTGVLDQSNPYPPPPPYQTAGFNGSASSLQWQQEVRCGSAGLLEGFELYVTGSIGASMNVGVRVGAGWNTTPVVFQSTVTRVSSAPFDVVFVDCSSAGIQLSVNDAFVIEIVGNNSACGFNGTYLAPPAAPSYAPNLYLGPNATGCFSDCGWRVSFKSYMLVNAPPAPYCTPGTTSSGCTALINASAQPSVTNANPCSISVSNVEGQKTGIVFYGLEALPQPWCPGGVGSSLLCVKPPTQRSFPQQSGGANGVCNGVLQLDWNAFQLGTPGSLGTPWSAGDKLYVQAWFRDPASCRTTSLSNGVELTYRP